ncbi:MAG: hypothetical protein QGI68_15705 [Pseudomonadales bacterium]|nr:hypothetical protein [Pseudomonadales bacterium]MDP7359766.1 hypothetical protein [Pseudomonadales bacterium]MDP7596994.1 hypothetical protein [Pseudomonadales bacterium]HJN52197.1 hypothetical protein [Pseudomonadales bacterium]
MRLKWKGQSLCLMIAFLSAQVLAGDEPKSSDSEQHTVYEYVTCAVYYRMLIGALKSNPSDLSSLEDVYLDQMNRAISQGRRAARKEWGAQDADKEFDLEWQSEYGEMITEIDKNYSKIRKLKMKYADSCDQITSTGEQIKLTGTPVLPALALLD